MKTKDEKNSDSKKPSDKKAKSNKKKKSSDPSKKQLNNKTNKAKQVLEQNKLAEKAKNSPEKEEEKQISKPKRVFNIIKNTVCGIIIGALALTLMSFLIVRIAGGTPNFFGYSIQRVASGSMVPALQVGDIILSKTVKNPEDIDVDDIITYKGDSYFDYKLVTHRVVTKPHLGADDEYYLTTKGDANEDIDPEIRFITVQSKYIRNLDFLNWFYDFFLSPWGLIVFVGALLIIFFDELLNVIKILTGNYKDEDDEEESINQIIERLKREDEEERIRQEEELERKRKRREKYDNKSNKKKKKAKKASIEQK